MAQQTIDVEMPDGVIVQDVPAGTTQAELQARYAAHKTQVPAPPPGFTLDKPARTPSVDDLLGPAPATKSVADILGPATPAPPAGFTLDKAPAYSGPSVPLPQGWAPVNHKAATPIGAGYESFLERHSIGQILDAFGQGAKDGWGTGAIGLSAETDAALRKVGYFKNGTENPLTFTLKTFNEALLRTSAAGLDAFTRAGGAIVSGFGAATGEVANQTGLTHAVGATPDQARRDFEGMAQSAVTVLGMANELGVVARPSLPVKKPMTAAEAWDQPRTFPGEAGPAVQPSQPLPPLNAATPLSQREFYNQYVQHIDLRGRASGNAEATREAIMRDGFRQGANVNAVPPYRGGEPTNAVDALYRPKEGDVVYLAPREAWKDQPNGPEVQSGWQPKTYEAIRITDPSKSMYDNYREAFEADQPGPSRVMPAAIQPAPAITSPTANRAGNINLDHIAAPEDVKDVIRKTAIDNGGYMDARRGVISTAQTEDLANALGMTPESLNTRKIGTAFNAEEITAARNLLVQSAANVRDLATKAAGGDATALQDFVQAEARHKSIQEQVAGITAEGGRALNAFKIMAGQAKDANALGDVLNSLGDSAADAAARAKAIGDMDSPDKVSRFLNDSRKASFKDMFLEYWINGLLSGPATHTTYMAANGLYALWKSVVETPIAAGIGKVRQMFPDADASRVYLGEAGAELHGIMQGAHESLIPAGQAIKSGIPGALPGEDPWLGKAGAIPGIAGKVIRVPSNVIAGLHTFSRGIGYRQSINKQAYRAASAEGLSGDDFARRVGAIAADPTEEMMTAARDEATSQAFMTPSDATMGALEKLTNKSVAAKVIMPFVRIGSNIIKQALVERTPLGLLSEDVRANLAGANGAIARDEQMARMAAGSGLGIATMGLAAKGLITGGGPSDPRENAVWRMTGRQPYSVRIGDTWYGLHRLGSLGMLMGVSADAYDIAHRMSDDDSANLASLVTSSISRNVLEESWMRGVAELVQATDDPDRYGRRYVDNMAASMVPFSVGMAQLARAVDPDLRSARTLVDTIKSRVPFLSETVLPRFDIWGQPMENQGALGPDGLSAIYESRVNNDPVNRELLDLGIFPSAPEQKIRGARLTADQYAEFQKIAGRLAKTSLDEAVNSQFWYMAPEFARKEIIQNTIRATRQAAEGYMQMEHPELIDQAVQNRMKEIGAAH